MPTEDDRQAFVQAIKEKNTEQIRMLLERDDAKELLLMKENCKYLTIHFACNSNLDAASLQIILDTAVKHGIIKKMLEEKDNDGWTCIHHACDNKISIDSLRLFLEYLLKHADIKNVLEQNNNDGWSCLHLACLLKVPFDFLRLFLGYLSKHADIETMLEEKTSSDNTCLHFAFMNLKSSTDSLRLLISFFPSNESLQLALASTSNVNLSPLDLAENDEHKQLLQDPDCWKKCRYWLFCNHQETFLNSLFPNAPEKTLEALKELNKNYADDESFKKAIASLEGGQDRSTTTTNKSGNDDHGNDELKKNVEVLQQEK